MRVFALVAVLACVLTLSFGAHAEQRVFGSATCRQAVSCPSNMTMSSQDLAAAGDRCMAQDLGLGGTKQYFDEYAGVDSDGCLREEDTSNPAGMHPKCCIVTVRDGVCAMRCQILMNSK